MGADWLRKDILCSLVPAAARVAGLSFRASPAFAVALSSGDSGVASGCCALALPSASAAQRMSSPEVSGFCDASARLQLLSLPRARTPVPRPPDHPPEVEGAGLARPRTG